MTKSGLLRLDKTKINTETALDGKYLLRTSDLSIPAEDIARGYDALGTQVADHGPHYAMAWVASELGLRSTELCSLRLDDCHFDHGPLGKIHVRIGKGARGSGPQERLVPMLGSSRAMLMWWVTEVRGELDDDFELPRAALFPSERGGRVTSEAFRLALKAAALIHLLGPVRVLTPHVLRHA